MGEMVERMAMWLHRQHANDDDVPMVPWPDVSGGRKTALRVAARDMMLTMRRPTLNMRAHGRIALGKGEAEVWRTMVDGALTDD